MRETELQPWEARVLTLLFAVQIVLLVWGISMQGATS
jgi:hypothetical protein